MFATLIASRPIRQRSRAGFATSIALHGFLVVGAVYLSLGKVPALSKPPQQTVIYYPPADPPKPPPTPVTIAPPRSNAPPTLGAPITVPLAMPALPDTPSRTVIDILPGTPFVLRGTTTLADPGPAPGQPWLANQVELTVALEKGSPVPKFPTALRSTGIEGTARFRFVVDTLGRVELASVQELQSSHPAFGFAVRQTLPRMRFAPAQVGGHPGRQLVELPMVFRLTR